MLPNRFITASLGTMRLFIVVKNKKAVNEADLSLVYSNALDKKMPAIVFTNGRLTKTAQNYLKSARGMLKVKILQSD